MLILLIITQLLQDQIIILIIIVDTQQKNTYSSNTNWSYNYNSSNNRRSKVNTVRTNQIYSRGNNSGRGDDGEIVKETRNKVQVNSRSQFTNSKSLFEEAEKIPKI